MLSYSSITDGSLVDFLKIPLGGTKIPYSPFCDSRLGCICLEDPAGVDRILSQMYIPNYQKVISEAVKKSEHRLEDIDILFTNQVKKSALKNIIQSVGLGEDKTMLSIKEYGHMGTVDGLFNLSRALEQGKLGPGDFAVLASSGAGFTWAAMALEFY